MGPRPIGRGYGAWHDARCGRSGASMGPRPIGLGYPLVHLVPANGLKLQWGHDRLVADIACGCYPQALPAGLQWGHDRLVADIAKTFTTITIGEAMLQWGHDRLVADISIREYAH